MQRFQREARAAARLHHTNIVPVFGVGEAEGLHYYVMQFIPGLGLHEVLEELKRQREVKAASAPVPTMPHAVSAAAVAQSLRTGRFAVVVDDAVASPADGVAARVDSSSAVGQGTRSGSSTLPEEGAAYWHGVARIGLQAAEALAYAHGQGVLHRDIKPSNLLLDMAGNVWITDFGLAKMLADPDNLTHTGDFVGTLRCMAPERFNGHGDARSDVCSLGLTLYELLTLRSAFTVNNRTELIRKVLHEEPERIRAINPKVPRDLKTIVLKAMSRDPAGRYQTAAELADDLKRYLAGEPVRARPVSLARRAWLWTKRRPAMAALLLVSSVATLALVGIVTSAFYTAQLKDAKENAERSQQAEAQAREATQAALAKAEMFQYFHHRALVNKGWREAALGGAEKLLDECPSNRRKWEWDYLNRLCHGDLFTFKGHRGTVWSVAFSPDGSRLASASSDGTVQVWDTVNTEKTLLTLKCSADAPDAVMTLCVAYSPDGTRLVSGNTDQTMRVWDVTTGKEIHNFKGHSSAVFGATFSPDGTQLTSYGNQTVRALPDLGASTLGLINSPLGQGPFLAASALIHGRYAVWVWDVSTSRENHSFKGYTGLVDANIVFSADGGRCARIYSDQTVKVWDATTGQQLLTLEGHTNPIRSVAFSPDGSRRASCGMDYSVRV